MKKPLSITSLTVVVSLIWPAAPAVFAGAREVINHQPGRPPTDPVLVRQEQAAEAVNTQAQAEAGDSRAQSELGKRYEEGDGVPRDPSVALQWYGKAAEQGDPMAQLRLGQIHYKGEGVPRNLEEAFRWYRRAAEQGNQQAQGLLARMYMRGEGVKQDNLEAYMWFTLAGGDMDMGTYMDSKIIVERLSIKERVEAKRHAQAFVPKPETTRQAATQSPTSSAPSTQDSPVSAEPVDDQQPKDLPGTLPAADPN